LVTYTAVVPTLVPGNVVAVPVQSPVAYRLNVTAPATFGETVALSCGSQDWAVESDVGVLATLKHSLASSEKGSGEV
jgi:hypothetical protein